MATLYLSIYLWLLQTLEKEFFSLRIRVNTYSWLLQTLDREVSLLRIRMDIDPKDDLLFPFHAAANLFFGAICNICRIELVLNGVHICLDPFDRFPLVRKYWLSS